MEPLNCTPSHNLSGAVKSPNETSAKATDFPRLALKSFVLSPNKKLTVFYNEYIVRLRLSVCWRLKSYHISLTLLSMAILPKKIKMKMKTQNFMILDSFSK